MSTIYSQPLPGNRIHAQLAGVKERWHPRLHKAEVRVGLLFASSEDGPALTHGGDPVLAKIKVLGLDWRILTNFDALLKIDESEWKDLGDDSQVALLDHELSHIDVVDYEEREVEDDQGKSQTVYRFKRDDIGRPRLTTVPGDWCRGDGFIQIVERHGDAAIEAIASKRVYSIVVGTIQEAFAENG